MTGPKLSQGGARQDATTLIDQSLAQAESSQTLSIQKKNDEGRCRVALYDTAKTRPIYPLSLPSAQSPYSETKTPKD